MPGIRAFRTALRTAHIVAFGALYGGQVYGVAAERLVPALIATVATGSTLMVLEIYRAPLWLVQVRGVATLAKLALVAGAAAFWELRLPLLTVALVVGSVTSHMPGRWRYHSLLHGRALGPHEKG